MNAPKRGRRSERQEAVLPFDVTQDIDPALGDLLRHSNEPTLTQGDFDDLLIEQSPPGTSKPR